MLNDLTEFKRSNQKWHMPVLAGMCVGIPILAGYYTDNLADGKLVSLAGLVILYMHTQGIARQMIMLMSCSFGIMVSFTVGVVFSFDPILASIILGILAFLVHLAIYYLGMTRPPGNFFFILIASVAICMPYDLQSIPHKIGLIGIGTMTACLLGLLYSITLIKQKPSDAENIKVTKTKYVNLIESVTFGVFVGAGLLIGRLLELDNPYWIPASCAAVMQGASTRQIWQRSIQRILGTLVGLVLTWSILLLAPSQFVLCISIIALQVVAEFLVVRNYGIAVVFITVLTIFLAESGDTLTDPDFLLTARFFDILIGSLLGAAGGWMLYNERLRFVATRQLRKTKVIISKFR